MKFRDLWRYEHAVAACMVLLLASLTACGSGDSGDYFAKDSDNFNLSCGSPFNASDSCDSDDDDDAIVSVLPVCAGDDTGIIDACGQAITAVDLHDPVAMTVTSLTPNTRHTIVITDPLAVEITPTGGLIATSDADGEVNNVVIVQNMLATAELGEYTVTIDEEASPGSPQALTYTVADLSRVQCVDNTGNAKASFLTTETVFVKITTNSGSVVDGDYSVYIVSDVQKPLADGGLISGTPQSITVSGGEGTASLGTQSLGVYDVVVDTNGNGLFDQGTDLISRHNRLLPCFTVQAANSGTAIVQQIASDKYGNKRDIFDPNANIAEIRDIQATLTPAERSAVQQPGSVDTYLVAHQATWSGGEALTDVADVSGAKVIPVQDGTNSEAPWIITPFSGLTALGNTSCYDVVVDTDRDGVFDLGTDYVDNVDHLNSNACGVRVATQTCTNVSISSHADGDVLTDTAITLEGSIAGTPTQAFVTTTSGEQSNTVAITLVSGNFSFNLPLFNGENHLTVWAVYGDNSSCAETISITSQTETALFRAQLTWDGDTDMDLHVVRPGGVYYNPTGAATDNSDDCYYGNCNVGLAGTGSNSIDWGLTGEDDDPKLDVDCISCGNGIENIWMEQTNEDGDYEIYVDAYSGSETDVTVTVFILGTAVGQVNCGSMAAGSATDSCYVGRVRWVGGTSGIGSFLPSGTKANDF